MSKLSKVKHVFLDMDGVVLTALIKMFTAI